MLNIASVETFFLSNQDRWNCCRMAETYECYIEVKILYPTPRWRKVVSGKMVESITKLRTAVEELGGKIRVRY